MSRSAALWFNDVSIETSTETFPFAYPKGTSAWSRQMPGERSSGPPSPTSPHWPRRTYAPYCDTHDVRAGVVTDAVLVALCIEHGLEMVSSDSDFARFTEIAWVNPVAR